jgi:RHS repeat-associated protein
VYDGDGNRVSETVAGITTNYLVADANLTGYAQVLDELQAGAVTRTYSYGLDLVDGRQTISGTPTTSFYGFDGHGSVRFLTSSTGPITDRYDYDAYGILISSSGTTPNNYLFAGEQFDPALGVYYNRARYYDQRIGRFWTMDTNEGKTEDPISLHKYLYAGDNPVDHLDPSGHQFFDALFSLAIQISILAAEVAPYLYTIAFIAGVVYISTGIAIAVDENLFGEAPDALYTLRDGAGLIFFIFSFLGDAAQSMAMVGPGARKPSQDGTVKTVQVPRSRYPESAQHIEDAQAAGQPMILTVDRSGAAQNRAESLRGFAPVPGLDRDEYPPAMFAEGGEGASVRAISPSDNRGAGSYIGNQLRGVPDGAKVKLEVVDDVPPPPR